MKAMVLAAGRGNRLRPITDTIPKPLLKVGKRSLIEHHIHNLVSVGINDIVINLAYRGDQIKSALGDGSQYGANIIYSPEPEGGLETGGGIFQALPLLGEEPFIVLNSDFYTDYPFSSLPQEPEQLMHLVLVDTPEEFEKADFPFYEGQFDGAREPNVTFAGIGVYRPECFDGCEPGKFSLTPILREGIANRQITGEHYSGMWYEIGTPERWARLQEQLP